MGEPATRYATYDEYLEAERVSREKHEFLAGHVFAMSGGTIEHGRLAMALGRELGVALLGRPCVTYSSDVRVRIRATDVSTYPDVSVVCGHVEVAADDPHAIANPVLVAEVLSESAEGYDRGEKFRHYRQLDPLREYLLLSQDAPRIEVFRRLEGGDWSMRDYGPGERLLLSALGIELSVDDVYRDPLAA